MAFGNEDPTLADIADLARRSGAADLLDRPWVEVAAELRLPSGARKGLDHVAAVMPSATLGEIFGDRAVAILESRLGPAEIGRFVDAMWEWVDDRLDGSSPDRGTTSGFARWLGLAPSVRMVGGTTGVS